MPRPGSLGNINDPPLDDAPDPPQAEVGLVPHGHSPQPTTVAEQGKALPIVYGQAKVATQLLEKSAPASTNTPTRRAASTQVYAGEYRTILAYMVTGVGSGNDGTFLCTTGGITGGAADFTSGSLITVGQTGITDGGTVVWTCISLGNCETIATQQFTAALCEGEITGALTLYWDKEASAASSLTSPGRACGLAVGPDAATQNLSGFSAENYQHTAVIYALHAPTGTQKEIPAIGLEIKGVMFGGAGPDVSPADILNDLLTHSRRGAGWVSTRVDSSITGSGVSGYRTYCDAYGLRVSMVIDNQETAASIIAALLAATNTEAVWSQGALHAVPLGDTSSSSPVFGATNYTAPSAAVASFGPGDFLDELNPVQIQRRDDSDCFNCWPIEFTDRSSRYSRATVEDQVLDDVEVRGSVARAGVTSYPVILPNGKVATMLSRILGNRSIKNRNTYTLRVGWFIGVLLEPCDLITITEPGIGFVDRPLRVTSVTEAEENTFSITAEDWPVGVQSALAYTPQANDGLRSNDRASLASGGGAAAGTRPIPAPATVGAAQVAPGSLGVTALAHGNTDNLYPNGTSEIYPPANADVGVPVWSFQNTLLSGSAEWYARSNLGPVYSGSFSRIVVGNGNFFEYRIPAAPGDIFYLEAQVCEANPVVGENLGGQVQLLAYDDTGSATAIASGDFNSLGTFALSFCSLVCPPGTTAISATLNNNDDSGTGYTAQGVYDSIYFRRMVGASVVPAGALPAAQLTPTSFSNLWPNGSSENLPPPGADLTAPEWANRVNAGAGARGGAWVREVVYPNKLSLSVACGEGDSFFFSAWIKMTVGTGVSPNGIVAIEFLDAGGGILSGGQTANSISTSWNGPIQAISSPAPTGAVAVRFSLVPSTTGGSCTCQFDCIFADRAIDPAQISPGTAMQILQMRPGGAGYLPKWTSGLDQEAWNNATMTNSWVSFGSPYFTFAGYFRDQNGVVHLRGMIKSGTVGLAAFTLPAGYRPSATVRFVCDSNGAHGVVTVSSAGAVIPAAGSNAWFSLDGLSFDTR